MHTLRARAPKTSFWRDAQFDTMRLSLIKVAVRVTELVTKIKISLPTGFAYQHGFSTLAARLTKLPERSTFRDPNRAKPATYF